MSYMCAHLSVKLDKSSVEKEFTALICSSHLHWIRWMVFITAVCSLPRVLLRAVLCNLQFTVLRLCSFTTAAGGVIGCVHFCEPSKWMWLLTHVRGRCFGWSYSRTVRWVGARCRQTPRIGAASVTTSSRMTIDRLNAPPWSVWSSPSVSRRRADWSAAAAPVPVLYCIPVSSHLARR